MRKFKPMPEAKEQRAKSKEQRVEHHPSMAIDVSLRNQCSLRVRTTAS